MYICYSPQLFAAYHVLLRLPMPRHSPCALVSLIFFSSLLRLCKTRISKLYFYPSKTLNFVFQSLILLRFYIMQFSMSFLVGLGGLEPPTSRLSGVCSNLLSYKPINQSLRCFPRVSLLVEMSGFEPLTPCLQGRRSPS